MLEVRLIISTVLASVILPVIIISIRPCLKKELHRVIFYDSCFFFIVKFFQLFYFLDIDYVAAFRDIFLFQIPIITILLGYLFTLYDLLPMCYLTTMEITIISTSKGQTELFGFYNFYFCAFFAFASINWESYKLYTSFISIIEADKKYQQYLNSCIILLFGYALILLQKQDEPLDIVDINILLTLFIFFFISIILLKLLAYFKKINSKDEFHNVMPKKLIIVYLISFCLINNYKRSKTVVFANMVTFLLNSFSSMLVFESKDWIQV